jgi:hypothetical protein
MTIKPELANKVERRPPVACEISTIASANAPFIYFEGAPFCGLMNGVAKVTLESIRQADNNPEGGVVCERVIVAHLVGSLAAIRALRAALDRVLLLAEPTRAGPPN